jgi:hypothetical protein
MPSPHLPQELIVLILEFACEGIMKDLTTFDHKNLSLPHSKLRERPFGRLLNQFHQLILVSHSFHSILTHDVRVDGVPIIEKLLLLQIKRFTTLIYSAGELPGYGANVVDVDEIRRICGVVSRNPSLCDFMQPIFTGESLRYMSAETVVWFRFGLQELYGKETVESVDDGDDLCII